MEAQRLYRILIGLALFVLTQNPALGNHSCGTILISDLEIESFVQMYDPAIVGFGSRAALTRDIKTAIGTVHRDHGGDIEGYLKKQRHTLIAQGPKAETPDTGPRRALVEVFLNSFTTEPTPAKPPTGAKVEVLSVTLDSVKSYLSSTGGYERGIGNPQVLEQQILSTLKTISEEHAGDIGAYIRDKNQQEVEKGMGGALIGLPEENSAEAVVREFLEYLQNPPKDWRALLWGREPR